MLDTPTLFKRARSIADVNRFLQLLRSIIRFGIREGIIVRDPFLSGKPLICATDEVKREHILSKDDEQRLLEAARKHAERCFVVGDYLVPAIVTAIDSGMRRLEILSLQYGDVDFAAGTITVQALNSKTLRLRVIPLTARVRELLTKLKPADAKDTDLVFNVKGKSLYNAMKSSAKAVGLDFVRMTDFRHTFCTNLSKASFPIAAIARLSGHQKLETLFRYIQNDDTTIQRAADILNSLNAVDDADIAPPPPPQMTTEHHE
jgi:integrase